MLSRTRCGDVDITTGWQPLNTQGQGQQDTHSLVTIAGSYRAQTSLGPSHQGRPPPPALRTLPGAG